MSVLATQAIAQTYHAHGGCSEACSAFASITITNGSLTVIVNDDQANPGSAGDVISGIEIVTTATGTSSSSLSQSGALVDISKTGATPVTGSPNHWAASGFASNVTLSTVGNGRPIDMIIGPPGPNGYSGAASISKGNFDPFIYGSGKFILTDSDFTNATKVTSVSFIFGTSSEYKLAGIPEPASLILLGTSLAGVALPVLRRRRLGAPAPRPR